MTKEYLIRQFQNFKNVLVDPAIATKQDKIQFSTMPVASADYEDKVIQYTGITTNTYTSGHFYKCVEVTPATEPKTYTWESASGGETTETLTQEQMLNILNGGNV